LAPFALSIIVLAELHSTWIPIPETMKSLAESIKNNTLPKFLMIVVMASNLSIDAELLNTALKIGGLKSKKDTVNQALREFIKSRKMAEIIELFGAIEYDPDYDYKKTRRTR
jgi:hypothetical protein